MIKDSFDIFHVSKESFLVSALSVFQHQATNNPVYSTYLKHLGTDIKNVNKLEDIPFLPIQFFKSQTVSCCNGKAEKVFMSSGTGNGSRSKHYVADLKLYEQSFIKGFQHFYGAIEDYVILAVLPSYLEQGDSSLIYMVDHMIQLSQHKKSGYYSKDEPIEPTIHTIPNDQKILLIGVSYALLDLAESFPFTKNYPNLTIMDTGGMKGRKKEIVRDELHQILSKGFQVEKIDSEYSMTELMSQAYSLGNGRYKTPPWMQFSFRDANDPFQSKDEGGIIKIIDLANYNSCSFIETQDIGKRIDDEHIEILGRIDHSDQRGCSQLYL